MSNLGWDEYTFELCVGRRNDADLKRCVEIITAGGAVAVDAAKLRRASALVLARKGTEIVGVASVKAVRTGYTADIAQKSGFPTAPETPELGYVAVDVAHRAKKLSHRLVAELLLRQNGPLFATTDNPHMKRVLSAAGFEQVGRERKGKRGQVSLWLRS